MARWPKKVQEETSAPTLTSEQRNNPANLTGEDLRHLAWTLGMAKSDLSRMDDSKVREQLKYLTFRRYEDAVE